MAQSNKISHRILQKSINLKRKLLKTNKLEDYTYSKLLKYEGLAHRHRFLHEQILRWRRSRPSRESFFWFRLLYATKTIAHLAKQLTHGTFGRQDFFVITFLSDEGFENGLGSHAGIAKSVVKGWMSTSVGINERANIVLELGQALTGTFSSASRAVGNRMTVFFFA